MMNVYSYGRQWSQNPWSKIDFRHLAQTGLTNQAVYNSVGQGVAF